MRINFNDLGIANGESISFTLDPTKTAVVTDGTYIIFNGKKTSLSTAAISILRSQGKNPKSARGTVFWKYKDKTILEIINNGR